jgi:mono/diheme cytochrome c family protein
VLDPKGAGSELQERREGRRRFSARRIAFTLTAAGALAVWPSSTPVASRQERPSFAREVAPLLDRWCVRCHGAQEQQGGLRLDSYLGVMRGGDTAPAVRPGDPNESLLVAKVERRDRRAMPPRRALPAPLVARLRAWIAAGAPP